MPYDAALITQFREVMTILAITTGLVSSFVTLLGSWFMLKFRIGRHDEQIAELKKTLTNGNGLVQQVAALHDRMTRLESVCNERHARRKHDGEEV